VVLRFDVARGGEETRFVVATAFSF